jgi:branched-subunit amino acid aminotransferase/4-amino-4-deoxychorismate lyase
LPVAEGRYARAVLEDADEVFATMTSLGIVPITRLDGRDLPAVTPALTALTNGYWALVAESVA